MDHLICVDKRMVQESINSNIDCKIYTRKEWLPKHPNVYAVPDLPFEGDQRPDNPMHWGSGPYALLIAILNSKHRINLIGFDLYSNNEYVNNLYKGTNCYDNDTKRPVDPRYWIYQIGRLFEFYSHRRFKIYNTKEWMLPKEWKLNNVMVDNIDKIM